MTLAAGCASHSAAVGPPTPGHPTDSARRSAAARTVPKPDKTVRLLQAELSAVFEAPIMAHAQWAVVVRSLDSEELLYELNSDKLMMPASNTKIVTLAAAAHILGWDHRFVTTVESSAPVLNRVLMGDLVVRGSGDPTINNRAGLNDSTFDRWAASLKAAGIERIRGRIIGDDNAFEDDVLGGGWAWDYLQFGYAAPVGALQYNENVAELTISPGPHAGEPALVSLAAGSGLTLRSRVITGPAGTPEVIYYRRHLDYPVLDVTGTIPLAGPAGVSGKQPLPVTRQVAVANPTQFFAQSLKDGLVARGIEVDGEAVDLDDVGQEFTEGDGVQRRVLATTDSPPLREIAVTLMKVSQNQYAETLLKAIGAADTGAGSITAGRAAVLRTLRDWDIDDRSLVLADGSGLSRYNYVSAALLTKILERMYSDATYREPFLASLPIAGKDGTTTARMRKTRAEGNALVKTGSISNVRSLSGYVRTRDGEMLVFSMLANDFVIPAATVNWIADLGVEVLSNFTRKSSGK